MNCEPFLKLEVVEHDPLLVRHVAEESLGIRATGVRHTVFEFFEEARGKRCFDSDVVLIAR